MLVYLCAMTAVVWIALWVVRHATKDEPSGWRVSVGGIPGGGGGARLLDEQSPSGDYADVLETAKG